MATFDPRVLQQNAAVSPISQFVATPSSPAMRSRVPVNARATRFGSGRAVGFYGRDGGTTGNQPAADAPASDTTTPTSPINDVFAGGGGDIGGSDSNGAVDGTGVDGGGGSGVEMTGAGDNPNGGYEGLAGYGSGPTSPDNTTSGGNPVGDALSNINGGDIGKGVGSLAGGALFGPVGSILGGLAGQAIGDGFSGPAAPPGGGGSGAQTAGGGQSHGELSGDDISSSDAAAPGATSGGVTSAGGSISGENAALEPGLPPGGGMSDANGETSGSTSSDGGFASEGAVSGGISGFEGGQAAEAGLGGGGGGGLEGAGSGFEGFGGYGGGDVGGGGEGGGGGDGGGGGCFITEAVTSVGGQGDDAMELNTLRAFRDQVMASTPQGQALIGEYEAIAPVVVDAIMQRPDSLDVFQSLNSQFIVPAVQAVQQGDYETALQIYARMIAAVTPFAAEAADGQQGVGGDSSDMDDFGAHAAAITHDNEGLTAITGAEPDDYLDGIDAPTNYGGGPDNNVPMGGPPTGAGSASPIFSQFAGQQPSMTPARF